MKKVSRLLKESVVDTYLVIITNLVVSALPPRLYNLCPLESHTGKARLCYIV